MNWVDYQKVFFFLNSGRVRYILLMYEPPFIIISSAPTTATMGSCPSLQASRDYVAYLQGLGLCQSGSIGCYRNKRFVTVEKFGQLDHSLNDA